VATVVGIPLAALPAAATLTGDELVPIAQGVSGAVKKSTTGAFVTLASGVIVPAAVAAATAAAVPAATAAAIAAIVPVANASLANMAQATVKGRAAGAGTGVPQDLTQTQLTALINLATSILAGAVPASGGGTTNFLRADMSWAPAGGGGATPLVTSLVGQTVSPFSLLDALPVGVGDIIHIEIMGTGSAGTIDTAILLGNGNEIDLDNEAVPGTNSQQWVQKHTFWVVSLNPVNIQWFTEWEYDGPGVFAFNTFNTPIDVGGVDTLDMDFAFTTEENDFTFSAMVTKVSL